MTIVKPLTDLTNAHLTMVGGILDDNQRLSDNDACYLRLVTAALTRFGIPLDPAYNQYLGFESCADPVHVDVLNLNGQGHGGKRDFLKENIQTDILMMANVAYRQSEGGDYLEGLSDTVLHVRDVFQVKNALHVSSQNKDEDLWRQKIRESGARIVVVVGDDDFPPNKIAEDDYIVLKNAIAGMAGILIRRDYLQDLRPHLKEVSSPLFSVAVCAKANSSYVDFVRDNDTFKFHPVRSAGWQARMMADFAGAPSPWA